MATRGGVNGSRFKILANWNFGLVPKCTPNPRVLVTVWSSYGKAIPTQESPRNTREPTWKQTARRSSWKYARYTHRLNRRTQRHLVGLTDAQSLQQWKKHTSVEPTPFKLKRRINWWVTPCCFCAALRVCFRVGSCLFLGLSCVGVASP